MKKDREREKNAMKSWIEQKVDCVYDSSCLCRDPITDNNLHQQPI